MVGRDAVAQQVEANLGLAYDAAFRAAARWPHLRDEILSRCMEGLWVAVRRFDPSRGCKLSTPAGWQFKNAVKRARLDNRPKGFRRRKQGERSWRHPETVPLPEAGRNDLRDPGFDQVDARDAAEVGLAALPPPHRECIGLLYFEGLTYREAGARLGVSHERVRVLHEQSLAMLRKAVDRTNPGITLGGRRGPRNKAEGGSNVRLLINREFKSEAGTDGSRGVGPRVQRETDPIPFPLRKPANLADGVKRRAFAVAVLVAMADPARVHAVELLGESAWERPSLAAKLGDGGAEAIDALEAAGLVRVGPGEVVALTPAGRMAWVSVRALL